MFEVDFDGFERDLDALWRRCVAEVRVGASRGVGLGARAGAEAVRRGHTFRNQTGKLEASVVHVVIGWVDDETYAAVVVAKEKYARFVEKGTPAHMIPGSPTLTFVWKGELVHFRYVMHPGTKPMPFMHLALPEAERVISAEVEKAFRRAQEILDA